MGTPNLRIRSEIAKIRQHGQIFRGRWVHVRSGTSRDGSNARFNSEKNLETQFGAIASADKYVQYVPN